MAFALNNPRNIKQGNITEEEEEEEECFGLAWFYSVSTRVSYLIPNPFLYI